MRRSVQTFHRHSLKARVGALALAAALLTACEARVDVRGHLPDPDLLQDLEVGHITKNEVADLLGTPSSISPFASDTWYYISERTKTVAFFEPEIKERKVLVIKFDGKGVARDVKTYGLEDARKIELVERTTPTAGKELTILKQLFGNIGRFEGSEGGQ